MRRLIIYFISLIFLSLPALAQQPCPHCTPPHTIPAQTALVTQTVMTRPPLTLTSMVPARHALVGDYVEVAPERRVWKLMRDAQGRMVGTWVIIPAQYANRPRFVMIAPPRIVNQELPALYETRQREVIVQPPFGTPIPVAPAHPGVLKRAF